MTKIICPYCSEKIDIRELLFRCINLHCEFDEDKKYSNYWRKSANERLNHVFKIDQHRYKNVPAKALCPKCKTKTPRKICPCCHNELPHNIGKAKENKIALIGGSNTGKSIYITVLINELSTVLGKKLDASLTSLNEETIKRYREEFYSPLYNNKILPTHTLPALAEKKFPLMYRLILGKQKNKNINLVFFDTAGEDLVSTDIIRSEKKYISNSSGIIFLIDPLQIPKVKEKLPKNLFLLDNPDSNPKEILSRIIQYIKEDLLISDGEMIEIPIALAITKIDAISHLLKSDTSLNKDSPHDDQFDIEDCEILNREIKDYLENWIGYGFISEIEKHFKNYSYFGLSSLGKIPTESELSGEISPRRIEDPFLWLLYKNKFILSRKNKTSGFLDRFH